jgi:hypothetical protein
MPFGTTSLARLSGAKPELVAALSGLEADFNAQGGDLTVPDFGGFRTYGQQAQLVQWRDDAVARGDAFYAVAPAGTSKHERGEAGDVQIIKSPAGWSEDGAYRWLADRAPAHGLVAGYFFGGGPPSQKSDRYHFELGAVFPAVPGILDLPDDTSANDVPPWRTDEAGNFPVDGADQPTGAASMVTLATIALVGALAFFWWRTR